MSATGIGGGETQTIAAGQYGVGIPIGNGGIGSISGSRTAARSGSPGRITSSRAERRAGLAMLGGGDQFVELGGYRASAPWSTAARRSVTASRQRHGDRQRRPDRPVRRRHDVGTTVSNGVELVVGTASGTVDLPGGFDFVYGSAVGTIVSGGDEFVEPGAVASGTIARWRRAGGLRQRRRRRC